MTVNNFFEKLRMFPDWNVDLIIKGNNKIDGIKDIVCDEKNGNLIIVPDSPFNITLNNDSF